MAKRGPKAKWTSETVQPLFDEMADNGKSLLDVCKEQGVAYGSIRKAIDRSDEIRDLYARARESYIHTRVAQMDDIARNTEDVQRARLLVDNIKWEACKVAPKSYGDKVQAEHAGNITVTWQSE